ncbi:hypothetical protein TNIN_307931 [Trichonephila inaurata madagascariensis]|uniref:Uncharacterized protein n=1 Tax=Trichonephila inaurata madagascariensis TaxID=2747483 RepID=A0A8X6XSZ6_9ARAC|nr:hypothetical protein TNIN_307931 [Trichonephila inaurata madagascariensis]
MLLRRFIFGGFLPGRTLSRKTNTQRKVIEIYRIKTRCLFLLVLWKFEEFFASEFFISAIGDKETLLPTRLIKTKALKTAFLCAIKSGTSRRFELYLKV